MADDLAPGSARSRALCTRMSELADSGVLTVACAESLTAGAVASRIGAAANAGDWFRGGVVAYSRSVKHTLLRVPPGPVVCETAARGMARSVAELLGADVAVAVTGVGGPGDQDGEPPGTVWFAAVGGDDVDVEHHRFEGKPEDVLEQTVVRALEMLVVRLEAVAR